MEERIKEFGAKRPEPVKKIINWAKNSALEHHLGRMHGKTGKKFYIWCGSCLWTHIFCKKLPFTLALISHFKPRNTAIQILRFANLKEPKCASKPKKKSKTHQIESDENLVIGRFFLQKWRGSVVCSHKNEDFFPKILPFSKFYGT